MQITVVRSFKTVILVFMWSQGGQLDFYWNITRNFVELCKDYSSRGRDKKNISRINYIISQIVQAFSRPYIWTVESKLYVVKTSNIAEESFLNKSPLPQVLCILLQLRIYTYTLYGRCKIWNRNIRWYYNISDRTACQMSNPCTYLMISLNCYFSQNQILTWCKIRQSPAQQEQYYLKLHQIASTSLSRASSTGYSKKNERSFRAPIAFGSFRWSEMDFSLKRNRPVFKSKILKWYYDKY